MLRSATSSVTVAAACVRSTSLAILPCYSSLHDGVANHTQRRSLHTSAAPFTYTRLCRFDLRQHEMEKRRLRELEKAGIDPNDEDAEPWIAPEEQQRIDEEEEQRRAELEEQRKAMLQKRAEEDEVKKQKFKEFRARQISMSRHRKEEMAEKKEEARQHRRETHQRVVGDEDGEGAAGAEGGDVPSATDDASSTEKK